MHEAPAASDCRPSSLQPALSHVVLLLSWHSPCMLPGSRCSAASSCAGAVLVPGGLLVLLLPLLPPAGSFPATVFAAAEALHAGLAAACAAPGAEGMRLAGVLLWVVVTVGIALLATGPVGILLGLCWLAGPVLTSSSAVSPSPENSTLASDLHSLLLQERDSGVLTLLAVVLQPAVLSLRRSLLLCTGVDAPLLLLP